MPDGRINFGGRLARAFMLGVLSLLVGLLVAGLALPAAAGLGVTTKNAIGDITFSELPASLQSPPLSQLSVIKAADGTPLATFYYENRQSVSLYDVAPTMRQAIVAIEDSRFYEHHGVDPKGILRALLKDTSSGAAVQGASTITQQYVRQALVETNAADNNTAAAAAATSKNLTRKLTEARYALALEQKLSKDQILEDYLNTVYFGSGAYGISAAAQHYFGETADQLTLTQSALLAGVINNPSTFDPTVNPKNALARRNVVLDRMLVNYPDTYTSAQIQTAEAAPLGLNVVPVPNGCATSSAPFFCDYVVHDILNGPEFGATVTDRANLLRRGGLVVTTTLQPAVQKAAQSAVDTVVPENPALNAGLAAAIDMVNPQTGAIEAMAVDRPYGTGFGQTEVNLAADYVNHGGSQGRNAGSTFKIFVLAAALEEKIPTGTTIKSPPKITIPKGSTTTCDGLPTSVWNVVNAEVAEGGTFNMVQATAESVNTYFAQLEVKTGLCAPITIAQDLGVHKATGGNLDQIPAFTLGAEPVDPLSVTGAFAALANNGTFCTPQSITKVTWQVGDVTTNRPVPGPNCGKVLDPTIAQGVTTLLQGVLAKGGTGYGLALGRPAAAKTGTDDEFKNAWFSGYAPNLASSVWVGNPDSTVPMRAITVNNKKYAEIFGATLPGPIWQLAMKGALANQPIQSFTNPPDVVLRGNAITIPNLQGQDPAAAAATLTKLGLSPAVDPTKVTSSQPLGKVETTVPAAGATVYAGALVKLELSNGIPPFVSPPPASSEPPSSQPPSSPLPGSPSPSPSPITITGGTPTPTVTPSPTTTPTH
ncbi:MAG TPA: transglycosylase domain-containing protein [Acidothermaceae bacterium]|nr:transglycosylase domain-containing protein [Acidothermaceae bacterium]